MKRLSAFLLATIAATPPLRADNNPSPSQPANAVSPPFAAASIDAPFPDAVYGADHGGSSLSLAFPFTSPFGDTDHSRGVITYACAPFSPRNSEGIYGIDVWLEQADGGGNWSAAALNGGLADNRTSSYQPVNTPNPGPSPGYTFTWTFNQVQFPPNTSYRVFIYIYLFNQGGGSQGNFYAASTVGTVSTGPANDAPRLSWTTPFGSTNPTQVQAGESYVISADGQDDNGNLATVSIDKNGQPFAYAGGGNGYSGNSQNPTSDPAGTSVFTAWAGDSYGAQSPALTWTVTIVKGTQAPVGSANTSLGFYTQAFTPATSGGSGSGAWQFVVGGYTNWSNGADANAGTELPPANTWSASWMPPSPGTYPFWVARDGDGNFAPSGPSSAYTLTVTPAPPVGSFDGISSASLVQGQVLSGSGWAADAQSGSPLSSVRILIDGGTGGSYAASLGGSRPDVQAANLAGGHWSPSNLTASGWSFSVPTSALAPGAHTVTAVATDSAYGVATSLGPESFAVTVPPPVAPSASLTATPAAGAAPLPVTVSWATSNATSVTVTGSGLASTLASGSQTVALTSPGNYLYAVNAGGPGGTASASASVAVAAPQFTLATFANGDGSVTPGGTYPANTLLAVTATPGANAGFAGWTGGLTSSADPLSVTLTGNLTLVANFSALPAPPPPAPAPPAPPAAATSRIRFNMTGRDARVTPQPPGAGTSLLWTDPAGLQASPWPAFTNPAAIIPATGSFSVPPVPTD